MCLKWPRNMLIWYLTSCFASNYHRYVARPCVGCLWRQKETFWYLTLAAGWRNIAMKIWHVCDWLRKQRPQESTKQPNEGGISHIWAFSPFFSCQVAETSRSLWPYGSDQVVFCFEPNLGIVECSNLRFEDVLIWNVVRCILYHNKKSHFPLTFYGKNIFKSTWIMSCMLTILHQITIISATSKELAIQSTPCIRS